MVKQNCLFLFLSVLLVISSAVPSEASTKPSRASSSTTAVSVSISPTTASVPASQSKQFTATVAGTTNTAVNWYVNGVQGGSAAMGTISSNGLYTASACYSSSGVSVTAQSVYDFTANAQASVALTAATTANDLYVATNGSDSSSGTACHPFATIQKAASTVKAGQTVHVAPGTYNISSGITTNTSGTATAPIRFVSDMKWGAKIVASSAQNIWVNNGNYVTIQGFDISGAKSTYGIRNLASYDTVIGNHIHNIPAPGCTSYGGAGIYMGNYSSGHNDDVIANVVHDIGDPSVSCSRVHGIYHANTGGHIYNNVTYRNNAWGIHLNHNPNHVMVANNLVFQNGQGGITISGDSSSGYTADYITLSNNVVIYNGFSWSGSPAVREYTSTGTHNIYLNNLLYGNKSNKFSLLNGNTAVNTIVADPQLVNYQANGSGDYHLKSSSPAINKGISQGAPTYDYDGSARPIGGNWDVGMYEYGSSASFGHLQ